ncbi:secretory phospholipase A2 receptor-like [Portunus trituberculatus]|uniref:secretory phospholipase A2 receptor-like n=1 Tax=Portunus trituberculatus TaxID=210409 RepID=UPI001E1CBC1B|nr:secretory phospholipase A2 receptor-like [Portunus trituberculatus]
MDKRSVFLLVVVVVVVALAGSVGAACPAGYHFVTYGTCIKLLPLTGPFHTTWEEANDACEKEGGQLISLDTPQKMEQFTAKVFELGSDFYGYPYWVGVSKTETGWRWLNGEELSLRSYMWLPNEPDKKYNFSHAQILSMDNNPRHYISSTDSGRGSACETSQI